MGMPAGSSPKRERQYEHIKESAKSRGASDERAKEIAARTVNKERARSGEARTASKTSTQDTSSGRRGGLRSGSSGPRGRTREQLYAEGEEAERQGPLEDEQGPAPPGDRREEVGTGEHSDARPGDAVPHRGPRGRPRRPSRAPRTYPVARGRDGRGLVPGRAAALHARALPLLGGGVRLEGDRGAAVRRASVPDPARRDRHPLPPPPLAARGRAAPRPHPRWPGSIVELLKVLGPLTDPPPTEGPPATPSTRSARHSRGTASGTGPRDRVGA